MTNDDEDFRQMVSDVLEEVLNSTYIPAASEHKLRRFIIPKPDPLEKLLQSIAITLDANDLREALDEAGLEIREKGE